MARERQVLIARHPETEANVTGRWVGRGNAPFTSVGQAQVEAVAADIVHFEPDQVWSSPLHRALEPATRAAARLNLEVMVDDGLQEMDFGIAEGLTIAEAHDRGIGFEFKAENEPVAQGGESRRQVMQRTATTLSVVLGHAERPAIVTHGGIFRSALVELLGLPFEAIWTFHIRNAQIAVITLGDGWTRLEEFRQSKA